MLFCVYFTFYDRFYYALLYSEWMRVYVCLVVIVFLKSPMLRLFLWRLSPSYYDKKVENPSMESIFVVARLLRLRYRSVMMNQTTTLGREHLCVGTFQCGQNISFRIYSFPFAPYQILLIKKNIVSRQWTIFIGCRVRWFSSDLNESSGWVRL